MAFDKQEWSRNYYLKNKKRMNLHSVAWQRANKDKVQVITKKSYSKNRDKILASQKESRKRNPEKHREMQRKSREKHKEKVKKYMLSYYEKNRERMNRLHREWVARNKEKAKQLDRTQYSRRKLAEGTFTLEEWEAVKRQHGFRCANCNKRTKLTVDHIIPLSKGGTNFIANIQPLCKSCNCSKNDKLVSNPA